VRALLAIVLASYVVVVVDVSVVIAALPRIRDGLGFSPAALSWVQNAYTLAFGGLLLLGARLGDVLGRRRVFLAGTALFTVASLAVAVAQTPAELLAARAAQGVGAAVLAPATLAFLTTCFPEGRERTRAVAWYGASAGLAMTLGLVLGGLLTQWPSWRAGFLVNVPIGVALVVAGRRYLPESTRHEGPLDVAGALGSTVGMTALVYGIVHSADAGWRDARTLATVAGGLAVLAAVVAHERRAAQPVVPLRLLADRERAGAYASRFAYLGGMLGFWFFVTQFLQGVKGYSPLEAGLAFLPATAPNVAAALAVPRLTRRFGNGRLLAGALVLTVAGMAWLAQLDAGTPYATGIALPMLLLGLGQGASLAPLTAAGVARVADADAGAASGLVATAHQLGGSFGLSVLVAVFAARGYGGALAAGTGFLVLSLGVAVACVRR
jgi:EmrB/QacA subfamily drug resistance transporter